MLKLPPTRGDPPSTLICFSIGTTKILSDAYLRRRYVPGTRVAMGQFASGLTIGVFGAVRASRPLPICFADVARWPARDISNARAPCGALPGSSVQDRQRL